jgi:hypothetical protein
MPKLERVPVKPATSSKINKTQAIAVVVTSIVSLLTSFGIEISADLEADILKGIIAAGALVTWYLRTYKTRSITPSSIE